MLRRARPDPVPLERVRRLLARPDTGGWVPPPEPGDGADGAAHPVAVPDWSAVPDVPALGGPPDALTGAGRPGPAPAPLGAQGLEDEPVRQVANGSWSSLPPPQALSAAEPGDGRREPAGGVDDEPVGPRGRRAVRRHGSAHLAATGRSPGLAGVLPVALRTGRLDPGRRGAAALVLVAVLGAVLAGGVLLRGRPQEVLAPQVLSSGRPLPGVSASPEASAVVVVAVAGEVVRPGLVRLPAGSRVDDALRAAGGLAAGGSTGLLNLARRLVDGEQVLVGVDAPPGAPAGAPPSGGLVDLNTATVADLDALPGIGPVLAQRIVDWRTENERFGSVDQLREVTGIGEATFADLEKEVTV